LRAAGNDREAPCRALEHEHLHGASNRPARHGRDAPGRGREPALHLAPRPALEEVPVRMRLDEGIPGAAVVELVDDVDRTGRHAEEVGTERRVFDTPRVSPQKLMKGAHRRSTKRIMLSNCDDVTNVQVTPLPMSRSIDARYSGKIAPRRARSRRTKLVVKHSTSGPIGWLITQPTTFPCRRSPTLDTGSKRSLQRHGSRSGSIHGDSACVRRISSSSS